MNQEDLDKLVLGESEEPIELGSADEIREVALALIKQTRRSLMIVSRELDRRVYDDAELVDAVKDLALGSRNANIRIVTQDVSQIVKQGHRLVDLVRRLPSYLEIRVPAKEHAGYNSAFMLSDRVGVMVQTHADRYAGTANFNDRRIGDDLSKVFGEMWEPAKVPPDLRVLSI